MKKVVESLAENLDSLEKQRLFGEKYEVLMKALIELKQQSAVSNIIINSISFPQFWYIEYPQFEKDLKKMGLDKRILGFDIKSN